jgi:hypothetical protein
MTLRIETQAPHIDMLACCADVSVGRSPALTAVDLHIQARMHQHVSGQPDRQGKFQKVFRSTKTITTTRYGWLICLRGRNNTDDRQTQRL